MNNRGFGLVEVMITIAILSVVMLGVGQTINNAILVSQTADTKASLTSLVSSTSGVAFNQMTCTKAVTLTPQLFGNSVEFNGLKDGVVLTNYNLSVKSLTYDNPVLVGTGSDGVKAYYGTLVMTAESTRPIYGSKAFSPRVVAAIYITVDPSNQILGCGPVMPVLASTNTLPPDLPIPAPLPNYGGQSGCSDIGGIYSEGICTLHSRDKE